MKILLKATALRVGLDRPVLVLAAVLLGVLAALSLYPQMGKDFLPAFKEETALVAATSAPGTSLEEMNLKRKNEEFRQNEHNEQNWVTKKTALTL